VLVRTWNLFHGNSVPPGRTAYLEPMVRLAATDRPDVLLLQELPLWAFDELAAWSGMQAFTQVAHRTPLGARLGGTITRLHPGVLRSAVSGQGSAILLDRSLETFDYHALVLNPLDFRKRQPVGLEAQLAWAKERRILQAVRVRLPDDRRMLAGNLHATSYRASPALATLELRRARDFFLALAQPGEIEVLGGDFNLRQDALGFFAGAGFSAPGSGIDHVLVRGAPATPPESWPDDRRRIGGVLVSDHAPLEVRIT
jgi:endonuclease/exonuclease/phosphatase (EEP) superfamily protein YafD